MAVVSELLLKKRKRQEGWAAEKAIAAAATKKNALAARRTIFKRAEAYAKEYRATVRFLLLCQDVAG
jgi:large subunit ribosomal protein L7e